MRYGYEFNNLLVPGLILLILSLLYLITTALQRQGEQVIPEDSIPYVALATLDGRALPLAETLTGNRALLSFINPDCDHCRYEVEALCSDPERPSDLPVVFVSGAPVDSLRALAEPWLEVSDIYFAHDSAWQVSNQLGVRSFPTTFLYRADGTLLTRVEGEAKPSYLYGLFAKATAME